MTNEIVERAARNNALWCDAVCSTRRGPGEFRRHMWINRHGVPRYYPDVVTLIGAEAASAQTRTISAWVRSTPPRRRAVKDSFQSLDLSDLGFTPLFDAQWIGAAPEARGAGGASRELQWRRIDSEAALLAWEQSWSLEPIAEPSRIFMPRLLSEPDIHFLLTRDRGRDPGGGGVLNRGAGAVGISNVFASDADLGSIWAGLAGAARSVFPGLPLVAYDHRTEHLEAAYRVGFSPIGRLRVWHNAPSEPGR